MKNAPAKPEAQPGHDGNAPEYIALRDLESVDKLTGRRVREKIDGPKNIAVDRVEWLFECGKISKRQWRAATHFQEDWQIALIAPAANQTLVHVNNSTADQLPGDAKVAAMKRHRDAMLALGRWHRIVELVVLENRNIKDTAAMLQIHAERAGERLDTGLTLLADHYRLPEEV